MKVTAYITRSRPSGPTISKTFDMPAVPRKGELFSPGADWCAFEVKQTYWDIVEDGSIHASFKCLFHALPVSPDETIEEWDDMVKDLTKEGWE